MINQIRAPPFYKRVLSKKLSDFDKKQMAGAGSRGANQQLGDLLLTTHQRHLVGRRDIVPCPAFYDLLEIK